MSNKRNSLRENVLGEAEKMLLGPSLNARRHILLFVNSVALMLLIVNLIGQLALRGHTNNPQMDWIYFSTGILFTLSCMIMIGFRSKNVGQEESRTFKFFSYGTVILFSIFSVSLLYVSQNPPLALLVDAWTGIPVILITFMLTNKPTGLIVSFILLSNLLFAANKVGFKYVYNSDWNFPESIPMTSFLSFILTYFIMSILLIYQESGIVRKILTVIPRVVENIRKGSEEKARLEVENVRLGTELSIAKRIQTMILPKEEETLVSGDYSIYGIMETAAEVGGDYFDILVNGNTTYLSIGDVTDHGLESGLTMLMAQSSFRTLVESGLGNDLKVMLINLNSTLYKNNQIRIQNGCNMSLLLGRLKGAKLTLCGQHESILIKRARSKKIEIIDTIDFGMYVGLVPDIEAHISEFEITLRHGDSVLFYTDGIIESQNQSRDFFGIEKLAASFLAHADNSAKDMLNLILRDWKSWSDNTYIEDDITLLALKYGK
ncbi:SpoIIE-like protein phosphatase domain protein [Leptospira inadai serovar Lyme str. 10]|uniref:SpoIIE-like protein phosphatase domain protein n=2 Tax=Leptospira inadai serovar Lyme TaxID=293084 RepID=V6HM15_9LEPT|nr:PP2C family protein-serine/threonine phosphatase [Leptospira inadai]EQA37925.1 SpoIIE-like protein phosphatase domain protein [Leptospira inadai serovar Lyme str. 10]